MLTESKSATPFHFWISFWPVAPLFGVEWRFGKLVPGPAFFRPADVAAQMAKAGLAEAVKASQEAASRASEQAVGTVERANAAMVETTGDALETARAVIADAVEAADPLGAGPGTQTPADVAADAPPMGVRPAVLYDTRPVDADDLKRIKGVGPKLEEMLNGMGIYRFAQIAGFEPAHLAWVDDNLTAFKGRPLRDDWVAQAKALL